MEKKYGILYDETDRELMRIAVDALNPKVDRIDEIVAYAKESGIKQIGIANCISFERETDFLEKHLTDLDFSISRVNCKLGRMPNNEIIPGYNGISCNPVGQAKFLKEKRVELNLILGLCLGHEIVFNRHSDTLTTTLVVKDRKLKHNTISRLKEGAQKLQKED